MNHPILKFLTSLRLTVVCLALGLILVFAGTLAQVDEGLWNAQQRWFRSFFIWWHHVPVFPGGYTVGTLLLANLITSHVKRFTWAAKKIGIQLTHLGVIVLLLGQLLTDMLSHESLLTLREGESKDYSESSRSSELVFATDAAPGQEQVVSAPESVLAAGKELTLPQLPFTVKVQRYEPNSQVASRSSVADAAAKLTTALATVEGEFSTPEALAPQAERATENRGRVEVWRAALKAVGETNTADIVAAAKRVAADKPKAERLCAELKARFRTEMMSRFGQSSGAMSLAAERVAKGESVTADSLTPASTQGSGKEAVAVSLPEQKDMDSRNLPFAVVELLESGKSLGTWLLTPFLDAQEITAGGKTWRAALRFERVYHDFSTQLLQVKHEVYRGTITADNEQGIPKNFQSRVRISNKNSGEAREVDIYMNNPLRYAGLTLYQYQMGPGEGKGSGSSTFQVVRNPGWVTPYLGCILVMLGMLVQFSFHLISFIMKGRRPPGPSGKGRSSQSRARELAPR